MKFEERKLRNLSQQRKVCHCDFKSGDDVILFQ